MYSVRPGQARPQFIRSYQVVAELWTLSNSPAVQKITHKFSLSAGIMMISKHHLLAPVDLLKTTKILLKNRNQF